MFFWALRRFTFPPLVPLQVPSEKDQYSRLGAIFRCWHISAFVQPSAENRCASLREPGYDGVRATVILAIGVVRRKDARCITEYISLSPENARNWDLQKTID
jgi:hypothetical protein